MRKYIDQEAAQKIVCSTCEVCRNPTLETLMRCEICPGFAKIQAEDVKPVVHGRWINLDMHSGLGLYECSVCGLECCVPECLGKPMYTFCPNCGAIMNLEVKQVGSDEEGT